MTFHGVDMCSRSAARVDALVGSGWAWIKSESAHVVEECMQAEGAIVNFDSGAPAHIAVVSTQNTPCTMEDTATVPTELASCAAYGRIG
jgi:hypothetical protein